MLQLLILALDVYTWVIVIRALLSWFHLDPANPVARTLRQATEPVLAPLRKLVPPQALGGLDISPVLAILALQMLRAVLLRGLS